ncbi:hypothetical protein TIFTF001_033073 [Ficus carica]|uniref:Uncharacterized protein n=1 Tax=Ficus carica TaxID=3494 RepID=A0AA88J7F8_FICCA|nr:hypothetical protein TIFTF001_033073 [Ficus carica]
MYCSSLWIPVVLGIIVGVACLARLGYTIHELSKNKEIYARYINFKEVAGTEAATGVMAAAIWKFLDEFAGVVAASFVTYLSNIISGVAR